MEFPPELEAVEEAKNLRDWFGFWPSFHGGTTNEVDGQGHYVMRKHIVVEFLLKGISSLSLNGFNNQNVLSGLALEKVEAGFRLLVGASYGIDGAIEAAEILIRLAPGKPQDAHF